MTAYPYPEGSGNDSTVVDFPSIVRLHRDPSAIVRLVRMAPDGAWSLTHSARVADLEAQPMLPEVLEHLVRDSYFTIHGRGESVLRKRAQGGGVDVATLTSCFVDFDCHKQGVTFSHAKVAILAAAATGRLPEPSLIVDSGRGAWAFWLLRDDASPDLPVRKSNDTARRWRRCEGALLKRAAEHLAALSPDKGTRDFARVTRVPGSINSKAERSVSYLWQASADGRVLAYRMSELEAVLGIAESARMELPAPAMREVGAVVIPHPRSRSSATPQPKHVDSTAQAHGRKGAAVRWGRMAEAINMLGRIRGGYREGHRHLALYFLALSLKRSGADAECVAEQSLRLAECFVPRLEEGDGVALTRAIQQSRNPEGNAWLSTARVTDALSITPDELRQLLLMGCPLKYTAKGERRRVAVTEAWQLLKAEGHREPSVRQVQEAIAVRWGIRASRGAVAADIARAFPERGRSKGAASRSQCSLPLARITA